MSYSNYSMYLKSKRSKEHCCCVTGPTGPAGPPAADGTFWGDYLFWDPNVLQWVVGSNRINLGAHAGEVFEDPATGLQNLQPLRCAHVKISANANGATPYSHLHAG